jgi:hypothetical protein
MTELNLIELKRLAPLLRGIPKTSREAAKAFVAYLRDSGRVNERTMSLAIKHSNVPPSVLADYWPTFQKMFEALGLDVALR